MADSIAARAHARQKRLSKLIAAAALGWTALVGCSLAWNLHNQSRQTHELAAREARIHFNKDLAFRRWATDHGGVYVETDDRTPPSPWLEHIPERDLTAPSGRVLTLMNPAFMMRQVMEEYAAAYGVRGRITSLLPLNPLNEPDEWERKVLLRFETGEIDEAFEYTEIDGRRQLRLMRAMPTEPGCLKCHAHQGYSVGQVRGGIGVTVPLDEFLALERRAVQTQAAGHCGIWLVGMIGMVLGRRKENKRIAEEMQDERRMAHLSHQYELILNSVGEGIVGIDRQCRINFFSPSASRMLGWSADEVMGRKFHDLIQPGAHVDGVPCPGAAACCPTVGQGEGRHSAGEMLVCKSGEALPVEIQSAPVHEDDGLVGAVLVFHDISERLDGERRRQSLVRRLERSNRDLQDFAYVVSHDLQEPLRMVSSYMGLVRRRYDDKLDEDGREFIAFAVDGAQRMSRMIADLVEFSRVETRGAEFAAMDMDDVVNDALANLALVLSESGAVVDVVGKLPPAVGDARQLARVFQNLISNAVKFRRPDAPPMISIGGALRDDGRSEYWVADNGRGIAAEDQQRIFMIFQRIDGSGIDGTGIGLAVVKRIVERHGGAVSVESVPGQGAVFRFDLPHSAP